MHSTNETLEQELPNYLHHIKNKNSEESKKQYCISSLFEKIFDVASEDLDFEVPTKTVSKLRGRADTLFQNIIFEWICYASGGALIISVFKGTVDWFSYICFMAFPFFIFIYLFFFTDWKNDDYQKSVDNPIEK